MEKSVLIVVDVQKGFVKKPETHKKSIEIAKLTGSNLFDFCISTRFINTKNSPFMEILGWKEMTGFPEVNLANEDIVEHTDMVITRNTYSSLTPELIYALYELGNCQMLKKVYVCGIDTDCCVLMTATDLFESGVTPIVLENFCASNGGEEYHKAGLLAMGRLVGRNNIKDYDIEDLRAIKEKGEL